MLYINLLTVGVSQLNRVEHPDVKHFTEGSPDRVYAFAVTGHENSKAGSALRTVRPFRDAANANVANLSYACASTLPNTLLKFS